YHINEDRWEKVFILDKPYTTSGLKLLKPSEPCPRIAHQFIYDEKNKIHYLFGGNPGESFPPDLRLNDFWTLELKRPSHKEILRWMKLELRTQKFIELCLEGDSLNALNYLKYE